METRNEWNCDTVLADLLASLSFPLGRLCNMISKTTALIVKCRRIRRNYLCLKRDISYQAVIFLAILRPRGLLGNYWAVFGWAVGRGLWRGPGFPRYRAMRNLLSMRIDLKSDRARPLSRLGRRGLAPYRCGGQEADPSSMTSREARLEFGDARSFRNPVLSIW